MRLKPLWILSLLAAILFAYSPPVHAGGVVSTCDEPSLLAALSGGGTVTFTCSGTIIVTATITPTSDTTIDGTGQQVTISGGSAVQVFSVPGAVTVALNRLTVADGTAGKGGGIGNNGTLTVTNSTFSSNSAAGGGGVYISSGTVTVTNSTFSGNSATGSGGGITNLATLIVTNSTFSGNSDGGGGRGGGIENYGTLTVTNSTFSGNIASGTGGGGIFNGGTPAVTVTNSTFSGNSGTYGGGILNAFGMLTVTNSTFSGNSVTFGAGAGIYNVGGTLTLRNTLLANNSGGDCTNQSGGSLIDGGGNLSWPDSSCPGINQDPLLDADGLQNNSGSTQTIALSPGSPAIDAAVDANCPTTDQRDVTRPQGPHCDIGAYELIEQSTPVGTNVAVPLNGGDAAPGSVTITFASVTAAGNTTFAPSSAGPIPPTGFTLGTPPAYYSLATTATFTSSVTVCINYAGINFASTPQLFHFEGGSWVDVTTSVDTLNQITCGSVSSLSPFALFQSTISGLMALVNSFNLPHGTANSLLAKLRNAQASVHSGNLSAACNQLNAFINEVEAQSGKKITSNQANQLTVAANGAKAGLGCQ